MKEYELIKNQVKLAQLAVAYGSVVIIGQGQEEKEKPFLGFEQHKKEVAK
jgi:hypothetical protein